ncbi:MAG: hypothetical protein ABI648_12965 [Betaproteobacteria bacterium]|jgi:hypothetical protein
MKPMSPEDHELEEASSAVSEFYRAVAQDEPAARLDAAIKAAARRDLAQPRHRHNWQRPASIAAMLVLGVSLVLVLRDNEPPLPSLERPTSEEAKLAKPAPAQLAMKAKPDSREQLRREDRPSRDRSARPDREPVARDELTAARENEIASGAAARSAPPAAGSVSPAEQQPSPIAEFAKLDAEKKSKAIADADGAPRASAKGLRKQESGVAAEPRTWLDEIDVLLRQGKEEAARRQLLEFRRQYPHYPLPDRFQALIAPAPAK